MADLKLERGKTKILQAEGDKYKRGLLVKLLEDGGYKVAYWYEDASKVAPVEMIVDGDSIKKDANVVELKFHPKDYYKDK
jgi:hypothetical protein|tara:strand:+ start:811 stop:1050 length:240 start_codon:yes stop_codon:yes gene_type:complete